MFRAQSTEVLWDATVTLSAGWLLRQLEACTHEYRAEGQYKGMDTLNSIMYAVSLT